MSKKNEAPKHEHAWKAVRFTHHYEDARQSPFGEVPAHDICRVGFECECTARDIRDVRLSEADARWMFRAEAEPVAIPQSILAAFND